MQYNNIGNDKTKETTLLFSRTLTTQNIFKCSFFYGTFRSHLVTEKKKKIPAFHNIHFFIITDLGRTKSWVA